jgi:Ran GTPase-activating protein (RanGAP) involved in mRNA processing and transport
MENLHVGSNGIPEKEMCEIMAIAMSKESMKILCEVPFKDKTITELDLRGKNLGTEGALVVAEYLDGNRALVKFDISKNDIRSGGGKALADALKGNQIMTELSLAENYLTYKVRTTSVEKDMDGVSAISKAIPTMGAMTKFDISSNAIRAVGGIALAAGLKGNQVITELNISSNSLGQNSYHEGDTSGVIAIANAIPDMGALSKLVMRKNNIHGAEAGKAFAGMQAGNTVLKELDLSSQKTDGFGDALDAAFAKEFAVGISDNGAMTRLNLSNNGLLTREGGSALGNMLKANTILKELDVSDSWYGLSREVRDGPGFAQELAVGIKTNGALLSLNISSNKLTQGNKRDGNDRYGRPKYKTDMSGKTPISHH